MELHEELATFSLKTLTEIRCNEGLSDNDVEMGLRAWFYDLPIWMYIGFEGCDRLEEGIKRWIHSKHLVR